MDRALFIAAGGMAAQQQNIDTIAEDLANADVAGFKGSARRFAELAAPGGAPEGTASIGTRVLLTQGKLEKSNGPFDIAIEGPGFFTIVGEHGQAQYTRDGAFERGADGSLRDVRGWRLKGVTVPPGALSLSVAEDGRVTATFASGKRVVGRIRIAEFAAPDRLRGTGGTAFEATAASGPPREISPGTLDGPKLR
ncbi:MAG TPA: flagellar hook basal-body protein, partial [Candidatus Tumulicola sp.]|nr:flagellar hook basal-body protein [Candidatus Tumulicola sp.]